MMVKENNFHNPIKSSGEHGIFNKLDWIKEAESKKISADLLRKISCEKKQEYYLLKNSGRDNRALQEEIIDILSVRQSANKTSVLMLGYSIELLLKACSVSLLIHAPKSVLNDTVKKYSHDLLAIAKDLEFTLSASEYKFLETISSYVKLECRYPVSPESINDYCDKINAINSFISNDDYYSLGLGFYERIRELLMSIDGTPNDMKFHGRIDVDSDGYMIFRYGGFNPVVIFKYSSFQNQKKLNNLEMMRSVIINKNKDNKSISSYLIEKSWNEAMFFEVKSNNLLKKLNK
ncbi:hypothetical protein [Pectobacterium carotovorum]|uniref:hypothetical protein n=1 Tax=Pectobacterium carotovorum TaxID=554 RepID=UPI00057F3A1B|nr:hypothetical protein [Pectobacterium carotovorum]KHT36896.1 hypothetical protein RC99_05150 [Pectobacterium carotovorum subsp. carotovorum]